MIGLLIVTHGGIGREMLEALHTIVGPQKQAKALAIANEDDMGLLREQILASIHEVDSGDGVMILTDMFGGTPSNLALSSMPKAKTAVLAGVNLPALIKLASVRETLSLLEAAQEAEAAGRKYIHLVTENLAPPAA